MRPRADSLRPRTSGGRRRADWRRRRQQSSHSTGACCWRPPAGRSCRLPRDADADEGAIYARCNSSAFISVFAVVEWLCGGNFLMPAAAAFALFLRARVYITARARAGIERP